MVLVDGDTGIAMSTATRITVTFTIVHNTGLFLQIVAKQRVIIQHNNNNKPFDRYASPALRHVDRLVGNLMEWALVFLPLLWCLAVCDRLDTVAVRASWMHYVGLSIFAARSNMHGEIGISRNNRISVPVNNELRKAQIRLGARRFERNLSLKAHGDKDGEDGVDSGGNDDTARGRSWRRSNRSCKDE
jgi:hypothetical protein